MPKSINDVASIASLRSPLAKEVTSATKIPDKAPNKELAVRIAQGACNHDPSSAETVRCDSQPNLPQTISQHVEANRQSNRSRIAMVVLG